MDSKILTIFESSAPVRRFSKGDTIYYQGDNPSTFYYLIKGRVKVYMTSADGMEKILSTASAGDILGEAAFFDKKPRISCAEAVTDCELCAISRDLLMTLIQSDPTIAMELLNIQATRIRELSSQIDSMTFLQADGRIARLLLQSCNNSDAVNLTHEEIAGIIGVSRVTVSKILNDFKRKNYLKTAYRKIILLDKNALSSIFSQH